MTEYEEKLQKFAQKVALGKELIQDDWWLSNDERRDVLVDYIDYYLMMIGELVYTEITTEQK